MSLLATLSLVASVAWAQAPCEATPEELDGARERAIAAFGDMDVAAFQGENREAQRLLGCLREPLTPTEAAAFHRLQALASFLDRDQELAVARFRSARVIEPDVRLPASIAPEGHPLDKLFGQADPAATGPIDPVDPPPGGRVWVDGEPDVAVRPVDRPAVIQVAGPDGVVARSDYAFGSTGPNWSGLRFGEPPVSEPDPAVAGDGSADGAAGGGSTAGGGAVADRGAKAPVNAPMALIAGVAAATSVGCYAAASSSRAQFEDPSTAFEDLDGLRGRTNGLAAAAGVSAGAAVGFGVAAFTVRW